MFNLRTKVLCENIGRVDRLLFPGISALDPGRRWRGGRGHEGRVAAILEILFGAIRRLCPGMSFATALSVDVGR
jgi:hypothetical protein